mmetsp:Transcript_59847/g.106400  ORF Transcript_59847/g.106400 Transcript_59847/m.106400 type:complete len:115 (-) Transcript_59847:119-463(-)
MELFPDRHGDSREASSLDLAVDPSQECWYSQRTSDVIRKDILKGKNQWRSVSQNTRNGTLLYGLDHGIIHPPRQETRAAAALRTEPKLPTTFCVVHQKNFWPLPECSLCARECS